MRTIIDIPDSLLAELDDACARESVSRAEMIRRAIKGWLDRTPAAASLDDAFGIWKGRYRDSLAFEDELRGPREGDAWPPGTQPPSGR
jgi:hypothetical protein